MYKIVGADQREYGPVTEEQVRQWIAEGRANAQTIVRFNDGPWKPLSTFPEFATALGNSTPPPPPGAPPPLTLGTPVSSSPAPTHGLATAGLICSILGFFCCGPLFSTFGLILSILALAQISGEPNRYGGKGIAIAGIIVAVAGYGIFAILMFTGLLKRAYRHVPRFR